MLGSQCQEVARETDGFVVILEERVVCHGGPYNPVNLARTRRVFDGLLTGCCVRPYAESIERLCCWSLMMKLIGPMRLAVEVLDFVDSKRRSIQASNSFCERTFHTRFVVS